MAGVQGSALAIAVSNAGGLGSLPCAMLSPTAMRDELAAIAAATTRPYNVNFFCHARAGARRRARGRVARRARLRTTRSSASTRQTIPAGPGPRAVRRRGRRRARASSSPPVVSFHFGLPSPELLARVKAWGAKVLSSATTVDEARWLEAHGVDAIIAQGVEAGGHRGMFLSDDLHTQVGHVRAAAADRARGAGARHRRRRHRRRGRRRARRSRSAPPACRSARRTCSARRRRRVRIHRAALKSDAARHTALTNLFTGRPARGIVNRAVAELGPIADASRVSARGLGHRAASREGRTPGSGDFSPLWSGQNATGCRRIAAADLTRELAANI